jgi:hypothetical protein
MSINVKNYRFVFIQCFYLIIERQIAHLLPILQGFVVQRHCGHIVPSSVIE